MRCFMERLGLLFLLVSFLLLYNCALEEQYTHGVLSWMTGMFLLLLTVFIE